MEKKKEKKRNCREESFWGVRLVYISNSLSDQPTKLSVLNNGRTGVLVQNVIKEPLISTKPLLGGCGLKMFHH